MRSLVDSYMCPDRAANQEDALTYWAAPPGPFEEISVQLAWRAASGTGKFINCFLDDSNRPPSRRTIEVDYV